MNLYTFPFNLLNRHYLFLLILFLNHIYDSLGVIETGYYPYVKRLYDGNYILLSSSVISFVDETFTNTFNYLNLSENIYSNYDETGSTTVAQFKNENNGYIVAIIEKYIYIFAPNGTLLAGGNQYSDIIKNSRFPCPVIVNNNVQDDNYTFTIITTADQNGISCDYNCKYLQFNKMVFTYIK